MIKHILFLVSMLVIFSCTPSHDNSEPQEFGDTIYVLLDYTEGQVHAIDFEKLLHNTSNARKLVMKPIRDQTFSKTVSINWQTPPSSGNSHMDKQIKQKVYKEAKIQFDEDLAKLNQEYGGHELPHSAILYSLFDTVKKAKEHDVIFIFSDMLENTSQINFRSLSRDKITTYLDKNFKPSNTPIVIVVEASRSGDDMRIRKTIDAFKVFYPNSLVVTNI